MKLPSASRTVGGTISGQARGTKDTKHAKRHIESQRHKTCQETCFRTCWHSWQLVLPRKNDTSEIETQEKQEHPTEETRI